MTVVSYQTAQFVMPEKVTASDLPKLDALTQRAMRIDAFSSTC
jgi:glutathione S-transferase